MVIFFKYYSNILIFSTKIFLFLFQWSLEISSDTQQSLLELVCFYNNQDNLEEDWIEERWYTQANKDREEFRNTWKYVFIWYI